MNQRGWMAAGILAALWLAAGTYWVVKIAPAAQASAPPERGFAGVSQAAPANLFQLPA